MRRRAIALPDDRDTVLWFHSLGNYHSGAYWDFNESFEKHLHTWLSTPQTDSFLSSLTKSLEDSRTIAELWEQDDATVGFLWVVFYQIEGYPTKVAEVNDLEVHPEFQRRGFGPEMLSYAERMAKQIGSDIIRSGAGSQNSASLGLHEKFGFRPSWFQLDKVLGD